jgi:hypothetical protein
MLICRRSVILGSQRPDLEKGAHSSGTGLLRDYEKANLAQVMGYTYLQATPQQVQSGAILPTLQAVLR